MKNNKRHCSFCGKEIDENDFTIIGNDAIICPECLNLGNKYINEYKSTVGSNILQNIPKPKEIKEFLDQYIIGQDRVKERVSVAIYNHYKRINCSGIDDVEIDKSNICLLGETGTGKCICGNTKVKIRNKLTGEVIYDTINNIKKMLISY